MNILIWVRELICKIFVFANFKLYDYITLIISNLRILPLKFAGHGVLFPFWFVVFS